MTDDTTIPASTGAASNDPRPSLNNLEGNTPAAAPVPFEPAPLPPQPIPPVPVQVPPASGAQPQQPPTSPEPAAASQPAPAAGAEKGMPDEIARILKDAKLPERRDAGAGQAPAKAPVVFDTMLGASVPKEPEPRVDAPASVPAPEKPKESAPKTAAQAPAADAIPRLHTLKDDLQGVVREQKISLVRAVALEQERRQERKTDAERTPEQKKRSRRVLGIVLAAVLLVLLGGVAIFGAYTIMQVRSGAGQTPQAPALFFAESTVPLPIGTLSDVDIKRSLAQIRTAAQATLGSIMRIEPTVSRTENTAAHDAPATIQEFLRAIGARAPDDLVRTFTGDFFLGVHTLDKNSPVLVIPISSYERAFSGMLAWEPSMSDDLAPFFTRVPPQMLDANGLLVQRKFEDAVVSNYDARVLKDDSGAIELMYTFPSRTMLIIAESPNSLSELLSRLRANRQL